ncbi:hypothetical protein M3P21_18145 [Ruegeria sp. 2012CJ41-6]|uniref:Tetratricopeptide repeat protein n=1 Tax=Ruegeria spongiae TaxID=2942209 RepID=A0ABT0Q993_9RHOB|nr:hypothetical protein [Ruegeria spongiae]MCL6285454.1 hypothetical protein [Ruegeria spongiae]
MTYKALLSSLLFALSSPVASQNLTEVAMRCLQEFGVDACVQPVRPDRGFKTLVLEYIDTEATTIGHTLGRFTYREIREFTTDVKDSVVIIAHNQTNNEVSKSGNPILTPDFQQFFAEALTSEMLRQEGHHAAAEIGRAMTAEVVSWGTAIDLNETVYVQPSLTLVDTNSAWKIIKYSGQSARFEYFLRPMRINFGATEVPKSSLFEREFLIRCNRSNQCPDGIPAYDKPSRRAEPSFFLQRGDSVVANGAVNQFIRFSRDGQEAYLNIYHLELNPPTVFVDENRFVLRERPSDNAPTVYTGELSGEYSVISVAKDQKHIDDEHIRHNWYQIDTSSTSGWFQSGRNFYGAAQPKNLVNASLYRLFSKEARMAEDLLERYLALVDATAPASTLSQIRQLYAFTNLAVASNEGREFDSAGERALVNLEAASKMTPFSPEPLILKALVLLANGNNEDGLRALEQAKDLGYGTSIPIYADGRQICFYEPLILENSTITGCVGLGELVKATKQ